MRRELAPVTKRREVSIRTSLYFRAMLQYASMDFIRDQLIWLVLATLCLAGLIIGAFPHLTRRR